MFGMLVAGVEPFAFGPSFGEGGWPLGVLTCELDWFCGGVDVLGVAFNCTGGRVVGVVMRGSIMGAV